MQRFLPTTYRTFLLVSVLVVISFLVLVLLKNLTNANESNMWVEHTYLVLLQANKLSDALNDCEIGNLRFLLSGEERRLNTYEAGLRELPIARAELYRLTGDNSNQEARLKELDDLIGKRLFILAERIKARRNLGIEAARIKFNTDKGLVFGQRIRRLLTEINKQEETLLQSRRAAAAEQSGRTLKLTAVGAVLLLILLSSINYILERDVFWRRRAEEAVRSREILFRGIFDNASVGIALLSAASGKFQMVNSRLCEITGYTEAQLLERTYQSITSTGIPAEKEMVEDFAPGTGGIHVRKQLCLRSDGSHTWVKQTASALGPSGDDNSERLISIIEDINAQVQAEKALNSANELLVRSNESLQQFAYIASHDLQEPLRTIAMFTELLAREGNKTMEDRAAKFLGIIGESASRMSKLIHALLEYSKASSDDTTGFQAVSLHELTTQALASLRARIEEEKAIINCGDLPVVYGDPIRLHQVLQNLIGNALKYRRKDLPPEIEIGCEKRSEEWVVRITDNGMGFQPQFSEGIFAIFKRLHSKEVSGTGVGLAVVKSVVQRHGGRVWAESAGENQGATFSFTIPANSN